MPWYSPSWRLQCFWSGEETPDSPASSGFLPRCSRPGLAISKALIEGMGGKIGFETAEAAGTTFYFELPAAAG